MPRTARLTPAGIVFHVQNRANARKIIFEKDGDYEAFERLLAEGCERFPVQLLSYCIMPNHWHLVLRPQEDESLPLFMHRLTTTHAHRWHAHRGTQGTGHLYQGPYKSFPVQTDAYLWRLLRYVERNPLRANLVQRAETWPWSSLWYREHPEREANKPPLCDWPIARPSGWVEQVNQCETEAEIEAIRTSTRRGRPFGSTEWQQSIAESLELKRTLRARGRPRQPRTRPPSA